MEVKLDPDNLELTCRKEDDPQVSGAKGLVVSVTHVKGVQELWLKVALCEECKQCLLEEVKCDLECTSQVCGTPRSCFWVGALSWAVNCRHTCSISKLWSGVIFSPAD